MPIGKARAAGRKGQLSQPAVMDKLSQVRLWGLLGQQASAVKSAAAVSWAVRALRSTLKAVRRRITCRGGLRIVLEEGLA